MLTDITIGQFFPGTSLLHRMDARVKVILLFFLIIAIFVFDTPGDYALMCALTLGLGLASHVPLGTLMKSIKPLWWILGFTFLIHLCTVPGETITTVWIFTLTKEGFMRGFFLCLRLVLLILLSSLLTFTTSPLALTDALEALMRPLRVIGVPAHELAMMMTIALRFIPTLIEETDKIMKAQQSRGVDFETGSILKRISSMVPILVPLFISAFRRADELAMAMEARCYRGGDGRTQMKVLRVTRVDHAGILFIAIFFVLQAVLKIVGI